MTHVAIITDTDASLSPDLAAKHNIRLVSINVHFGQETLRSCVDIDEAGLFARVDQEKQLPTTSAPTPGQFVEAYSDAFEQGADAVVCICVSSTVSSTYNVALTARELLLDHDITVLDSANISMGQGFMTLAAAEAAEAGATVEEITARAVEVGKRVYIHGALATLKYLAMSGRVSQLTAGMGNLLQVKPILSLQNGKLDLLERVRTRGKAWNRVLELTAQALDGQTAEKMAIVHSNALDDAQKFEARLRATLPCPQEIIISAFTAGLSVHTGAGLIGLAVVAPQ